MTIVDYKETPAMINPHGINATKLLSEKNALIMHLTFQPGDRIPAHSSDVDVTFYVLEGSGIVEIGNEKTKVKRDNLIFSPIGSAHGWYNDSNEVLRIMAMKTPNPNYL